MRFVTHTRWEMDDVSFLVLILAIMCLCVSGTTVESRCPLACTNLFKILRLFLSSLEDLISEFRLCLFYLFITWYIWQSTWRKPGLHHFWLLCYNFVNDNVEVMRTIFYRRGIIWETIYGKQLQLWSVDLISFFF